MIEKIYLHAGHHKSGSSSIQAHLFANRFLLQKKGYVYPGTTQSNHINLCRKTLTLSEDADKDWDALWDEALESKATNLILSADNLEAMKSPEQFEALLKALRGVETKVIFYIREQSARIESGYTQRLKMGGYNGSIEDFLSHQKEEFHFAARLNSWANYFGLENVIVRPFERSQIGVLTDDFLSLCGIQDTSDFPPSEYTNSKPSLSALKILRRKGLTSTLPVGTTGKKGSFKEDQRKLFISIRAFENKLGKEIRNYKLIPYSKAMEVQAYYKAGNTEIAEKFLNRKELFLEKTEPYEHDSLDLNQDDFEYWFEYLEFLVNTKKKP